MKKACLFLCVSLFCFNVSAKEKIILDNTPAVYYLSQSGAVSDAEVEMNSNTFGTDNTAVIQKVLDKAKTNSIIVYWDGKYSVTGLKIYSNTKIIAFEGCGAILRNNSNKSLLINANQSLTDYTISNITIEGGIWNGNGFDNQGKERQIHDNPEEKFRGWNSAFQFFGVENLKITDAIIYRPRTFALHAGNVKNVFIQNVKIDVGKEAPINCDGLHFDGPSENVTIRDCDILAKDDHIAFNSPEEPGGKISNITIDNIRLEGGLFGIRLYSRKYLIDNIMISNIHGKTQEYWLVADTYYQGYPNAKGNFGTVFIENINVESVEAHPMHHTCANIHADAECFIFRNISRNNYQENDYSSVLVSGNHIVKKLVIDGYNYSEDPLQKPAAINHVEIRGAKVNYLSLNNCTVTRVFPANDSPLLCVKEGGNVDVLQMNNIYCKGVNNIVNAEGNIGHISASNIIHTEGAEGQGTFRAGKGITIPEVILTNYTGKKPISGEGSFIKTRGEGFSECELVNETKSTVTKHKTVLILGNSLVRHGQAPQIGWYGDWGMAASVKDSDFVHLLIRDIHKVDPSVIIKYKAISDFERDFDAYPLSNLDSLKNPDMLIMRISENISDEKAAKDNFIKYYDKLFKYLAPEKKSVKIVVDGFWKKKNVNSMMEKYASKKNYSFVSITDLSDDPTNTAIGKFKHTGVAAHPSDKGMRMIEQRIWSSIKGYFEK